MRRLTGRQDSARLIGRDVCAHRRTAPPVGHRVRRPSSCVICGREGGVVRSFGCVAVMVVMALGSAAVARPQHGGDGLEPALLAEINWVRAHPGAYADRLREAPESAATDEAIDFLARR